MSLKLVSLSTNIVKIMEELSKNQGLARLLVYNDYNPFDPNLPDVNGAELTKQNSTLCRIHPYPFDPEATIEDGSFIRVYYPLGEFNENEVVVEPQVYIDIVVAKSLWLINDGYQPLIRPYEIMSRVVDMIGRRSANANIRLKFEGWNHLAVNVKFDAIRLYCKYFSVEA